MSPDAVLFDLDDTLCRYRRSGASVLSTAFERAGVDPFFSPEEYHVRYPEFIDDSDSMTELRERCFATLATERGIDPETGRQVARAYAAERDHRNVDPVSGLDDTLSALSSVAVGLVTNGSPEMQRKKLEAIGLVDSFDVIVHAGYDALAKPSAEPFQVALDALSATPERSYHVGNSLQTDVAGANAAGLGSVWVPEDPETAQRSSEPDHVVTGLEALPATLALE